nr:hypothetical protein [Tanacetum cinerariifolium]
MWEAIERIQQGESLNVQDVKTNLFWEFGKFTSHDGEFLQQLQPKWSRFVIIVKQQHKLDEVSYHKLFDILKQYQKEVNELHTKRITKNANPLTLVAAAQPHQDPYYQAPKSHKSYAPTSKASLPTRFHTTTRNKVKEIAKPITPSSKSASEEDKVIHKTFVSRPQLRSTQMKDKVVPNNSQVKDKKTDVEDHPMISSIYNKTKSVCNDSLKSKTSNVNVVCATCGKCLVDSDHFACVTKILDDVNARTKKNNVVPVSTRKPKSQANKSVATPPKKTVASDFIIQKSKSYYKMLYEKTSKA